jgi:hypothetical protein
MVFVAERLIKVVDFRLHRSRIHLTRTGVHQSLFSTVKATPNKDRGPPVTL